MSSLKPVNKTPKRLGDSTAFDTYLKILKYLDKIFILLELRGLVILDTGLYLIESGKIRIYLMI
jgi:hypothetical protein